MPEHEIEFELSVGDVLQVGGCLVTVIDIDGPEVSFRIEGDASSELVHSFFGDAFNPPPK